jgi:type I restriction enzyme S subunit
MYWNTAKLTEVVRINPRNVDFALDDSDEVTFLPMAGVEAETGRINITERRTWKTVKKGYTKFQENDVLVAKITPCMENGKACIARHLHGAAGAGSTEFHVFRPNTKIIEPEWLYLFLNQQRIRSAAKRQMGGAVGQQRVPASFYESLVLPLPDIEKQRELLESLIGQGVRITHIEEELRSVLKKLKQARASILKAAVEGRLVEKAMNNKQRFPVLSVGEICSTKPTNGRSVPTLDGGFPVLRLTAMKGGQIDFAEMKGGAWSEDEAAKWIIEEGDFFVMRGNGSIKRVGDGAIAKQVPCKVAYPDTMIRIRADPERLDSRYLLHLWRSPLLRSQIESAAKTTAGIFKINQRDIASFRLPIPTLGEQREIVAEVDRRLSVLDQVEDSVQTSIARCGKLRQAILKRAFGGGVKTKTVCILPYNITSCFTLSN